MTDKVVSFDKEKRKREEEAEAAKAKDAASGSAKNEDASSDTNAVPVETFEEIAEKNRKNAERLKKERLAANKGVLRSYRIKT